LESLGYVLMYFLRGSLPWQGLRANTKKQKYKKIMEKKIAVPFDVLCKGYPEEFRMYFEYCRALRFDDKPDYSYLKRLFKELFVRLHYVADGVYDWVKLKAADGPIPAGSVDPIDMGVGGEGEIDADVPGGGGDGLDDDDLGDPDAMMDGDDDEEDKEEGGRGGERRASDGAPSRGL
jgi:hypothetical protein